MPKKAIRQEKEDDDTEEILVYLDIDPTSMSEDQIRESTRLKMVGNEKKILLQVNNRFFEGNFDYSMGTHAFFEKDDKSHPDPLYNQASTSYKCIAKTNKFLKMNRVVLMDKQAAKEMEAEQKAELERKSSDIKLTRTYEDALNLFLPPGKKPPRKIKPDEDISRDLIENTEELEATLQETTVSMEDD